MGPDRTIDPLPDDPRVEDVEPGLMTPGVPVMGVAIPPESGADPETEAALRDEGVLDDQDQLRTETDRDRETGS
jgi:hypothetical protein